MAHIGSVPVGLIEESKVRGQSLQDQCHSTELRCVQTHTRRVVCLRSADLMFTWTWAVSFKSPGLQPVWWHRHGGQPCGV